MIVIRGRNTPVSSNALTNSRTFNDKYWAVDEALDAILDKIEAGEPVSAQRTENLITNRAAKHRRRRADFNNHAALFTFSTASDESRLHARCLLIECSARCSPREWGVLVCIGLGHTYRAVAHRHSVPEATAKTWVRRARLRLAA